MQKDLICGGLLKKLLLNGVILTELRRSLLNNAQWGGRPVKRIGTCKNCFCAVGYDIEEKLVHIFSNKVFCGANNKSSTGRVAALRKSLEEDKRGES